MSQVLPKNPVPLLRILLWNIASTLGKEGLLNLKTCSKAHLSTLALQEESCRGWGTGSILSSVLVQCPVPRGLWVKPQRCDKRVKLISSPRGYL